MPLIDENAILHQASVASSEPPEKKSLSANDLPATSPYQTQEKEARIREACRWSNIDELRTLALSTGGLLRDDLRQLAWPILLGCPGTHQGLAVSADEFTKPEAHNVGGDEQVGENGLPSAALPISWRDLPEHSEEGQVRLDVNRAFAYYPSPISNDERDGQTSHLQDLITEVLRRHPYLSYFQGYHDICQVFLLTLRDSSLLYSSVSRLSVLRIRDFMQPTLAACINQLRLIPELIARADPELARRLGITARSATLRRETPLTFLAALARPEHHLAAAETGSLHLAAMQGTITMYAHDVESLSGIARLFDALLAHDPAFSLYLFAEMVLARRGELLDDKGDAAAAMADDPDVLRWILQKLPQSHAAADRLDRVVEQAAALYDRIPPESLKGWKAISKNSVLKTGRHPLKPQTEAQGEQYFKALMKEMEVVDQRRRLLKKLAVYRQSAGKVFGLALVVGLAAMLLKNGGVREGTSRWFMTLVSEFRRMWAML